MPGSVDPLAPNKAPDQEPAIDPTEEIGRRLAAHRVRLGKKVSELARQAQVSPSLISQIERGQSRPSVSTLFAIAEALGIPIDAFFRGSNDYPYNEQATQTRDEPAEQRGASQEDGDPRQQHQDGDPRQQHRYLVRKQARAAIDIEGGVRWERLTPGTLENAEFLELVYAPHAESHPTLYRHPGTEMVLLLSGRLDILVGFDRFELAPGDSIHFPSSMPHRYVNPSDETARAVSVILHDEHSHSQPTQRRP